MELTRKGGFHLDITKTINSKEYFYVQRGSITNWERDVQIATDLTIFEKTEGMHYLYYNDTVGLYKTTELIENIKPIISYEFDSELKIVKK